MKQMLIISIAIVSVVITLNYIKQIKMHIKAINQCILMIENIEILLSYNNLSVTEIFKAISNSESYSLLKFIREISDNMQKGISNYILSQENITFIQKNKYLKNLDKENLISYFSVLGKSDLNGQIANCKTYKEIFKKTLTMLESKESVECKSTGTLIVGAGLLLIIIIF